MNGFASIGVDLLRRLQPLAELDLQRLGELEQMCRREHLGRGVDPFRIEEWYGDSMYLIKGELKLTFADTSTAVLVGGSEEAMQPLGGKWGQAAVSAKAITDIELLHFDGDVLDIMLTWDQLALLKTVPGKAGSAKDGEEDSGALSPDWRKMSGLFAARNLTRGAFAALPPAHIDQLLQRFQRIVVRRGEEVVRQGDAGEYYYLIETGRCQVTRMVAGTPMTLADLKPGDAFGEEALVADTTRNANVTMKTDGILLRLDKQDFVELLRAPLLHTLSHAQALQRVAAGAVWLDVRFAAEYRYDGIKAARNLPLDGIRQACSVLDPQKEYIVYCQSGRRSSAATFLLAKQGFRASLLEGGLTGGLRGEDNRGANKS